MLCCVGTGDLGRPRCVISLNVVVVVVVPGNDVVTPGDVVAIDCVVTVETPGPDDGDLLVPGDVVFPLDT